MSARNGDFVGIDPTAERAEKISDSEIVLEGVLSWDDWKSVMSSKVISSGFEPLDTGWQLTKSRETLERPYSAVKNSLRDIVTL